MNPILKYVGGKRRLAHLISSEIGEIRQGGRYVELFAGGAAVLFYLEPAEAILVDLCAPIINLYASIKKDPESFCDELEKFTSLPFGPESYLASRSEWKSGEESVRQAALLLYLNKLGFNGLFRLNKSGGYNVPWGKKAKMPKMPSRVDVRMMSKLLKSVELRTEDYSHVLKSTRDGDVVYCDPPYVGTYDGYSGQGFTMDHHRELAGNLLCAAERGVTVIASNIGTPEVRSMYAWATIIEVPLQHTVAASARSRAVAEEVLIVSKAPFKDPRQMELVV